MNSQLTKPLYLKHVGEVGFLLYFSGVFLSWKLQAINLLPKFLDIGVILIISLLMIFISYSKYKIGILKSNTFLLINMILIFGLLCSIYALDTKNIIWCLFGLASVVVFSTLDYDRVSFGTITLFSAIILCALYFFSLRESLLFQSMGRISTGEDNQAYGLAAFTDSHTFYQLELDYRSPQN